MQFRQTKHQVARGTKPDFETDREFRLIKRTSELRATYQIQLLVYLAMRQNKVLTVEIPKACAVHPSLRQLVKSFPKIIRIEKH